MCTTMKYGKGKVINMPTKVKKNGVDIEYNKVYIYIPAAVAKDSSFPFTHSESIEVKINPNSTITLKKLE